MSEELRLALMGGLQLTLGAKDLIQQLPVKAQALLCYLAMSGHTHSRQELVGHFWGESPEDKARVSLRVALSKMRQQGLKPYLIITRDAVTFNRQAAYRLDVEAFENCLERGRRADAAAKPELLRQAVDLYRGDFLDGFYPDDAVGFDEWMLAQRERLRRLALSALDELVQAYVEQESFDPGIEYANRLLSLDPWRESAHRQLMWLLARTGQRSAAIVQYETCCELLLNELGLEPDEETKELYEQIQAMELTPARSTRPLPPVAPTEANGDAVPFQAPVEVVHFMNREREVARFRAALTALESPKIYGTTGMGGVGKTSLAIHLAHTLRDNFPDGVLWANAASSDPMVIAESWALAYGYDFTALSHFEERMAAVRNVLAEKQALLILDDVTVASRVRPLLPDRGGCAVLLTMRNLELAYALNAHPVDLKELTPQYSRRLLVQWIGEARAGQDETAVATICQLLQNLPLALAIAGGYLSYRPHRRLADFARQLQDESNRLSLELGNRQVRASFAVSWQALDETQRRVFSLLAIFEGRSFTAEALAAVAGMPLFDAQERLYALANLSLLSVETESRYRQHALLADFAREQLGEKHEAYGRMARYFLNYATEHQRDYDALRPEWENLSAGIRRAHDLQMWHTVVDFTDVLREAWFARGRFTEARRAYKWAHEAAAVLSDDRTLARIFLHWGCACIEQNAYVEARGLLSRSLELHRVMDDQVGVATIQYHLARIALVQTNFAVAERLLAESQHIRRQLEDTIGIAETLYQQARLYYERGNYFEAEQLASQALDTQERIADKLGSIRTLRLLTDVVLQLKKELALAENYCQRAQTLSKELEDQGELAMTLLTFSALRRAQNQLSSARDYAIEGVELLKKVGDRRAQAVGLFRLSSINHAMKDYGAALETGYQSLDLCKELKDYIGNAFVLQLLGDTLFEMGQPIQAVEMWQQSLTIAQRLGHAQLIHSLSERLNQ